MQRILHVTGVMNRAGAETMLMNIYRNINREKIQFDFVSFSDIEGDYDQEIISMGGIIYKIVESGPLKRMFSLRKLLMEHKEYKIIHCHTLLSNSFHLLSAYMAGVKIRIVHSHNTDDNSKAGLIRFFYHFFAKLVIQHIATHFIACGDAAARFLFPQKNKYLLLPNSIDLAYFMQMGEKHKDYLRKEHDLSDDCLVILQLGRLDYVKNYFFSIEIAKELKRRAVSFKMFFVGKGELQNKLADQICQAGLENEIVMTGVRSDIAQMMAGADIMLMPSFFEGFPVVLVESQAIGLKALVSDFISREVDQKINLVKFLPINNHVNTWVNSIVDIKSDPIFNSSDMRNIMYANGFDIKDSTGKLLEIYDHLS